MKKNRIITIITIINITIIALIAGFWIYSSQYSAREIQQMVSNAYRKDNYIVYTSCENFIYPEISFSKLARKGNIRKIETLGMTIWQTENMEIQEDNKTYIKTNQDLDDVTLCNNSAAVFRYVKKEKYNNKKCIVVQYIEKYDNAKKHPKTVYWIDEEAGTIEKMESYDENGFLEYRYHYITEFDCVESSEMILPDIQEYRELN